MELKKIIQEAVKNEKAILGYRRVMKAIKMGNVKLVVMANNIPREMKENVEHNAKIGNVEVKTFKNDSVNLGLICGKPFSVSVLAIKGK